MNRLIALLLFVTLTVQATPPRPETVEVAFARFSKTYVGQSGDILSEIRKRIAQPYQTNEKEAFEVLEHYLQNIGGDDIFGMQRAIQNHDGRVVEWCGRLEVNIVGFRRTLDQLMIESVNRKRLILDGALMKKLKAFWEEESYFSWRFGEEVRMATKK